YSPIVVSADESTSRFRLSTTVSLDTPMSDPPQGSLHTPITEEDDDQKKSQHLPFSPATNPGYPGQLVAGDKFPGRLVARDRSSGKARRDTFPGDLPGRHRGAHIVSVKQIFATVEGVQAIRVVELSPEHFKSCKLEEGEWGAIGSIVHGNTESSTVTWTFEYEKISNTLTLA
ncbi:hypothetical protein Tco_0515071, partial [Tanacetum coccineum]